MRITRSIVPNLFTLLNLFMGFTAIVYTSQNLYAKAAIFILLAAIFDTLDGLVARLLKSASEFGVELDSLCDAVSFGVAPSYMLYKIFFYQYGDIGILISSLPALAGVIRLARFNVFLTSLEDKKSFTGLPIPSGALTIVSYLIFYHITNLIPSEWKPSIIISVTILTSLVMVSHIKFDNLPKPSKRNFKERPVLLIFFFIGLIISIITLGKGLFPLMILLIILSSIRHFINWIKIIREATDDFDEDLNNELNETEN